eukprot:TRINITY_DN11194_c0_g1_i1.p1 TRINITY_DN11194_c0_g1~~TRINITY_DN11194_c0_g1_i1.p1  ORF type:complete len:359 (+),score=99.57 TRINITY_DN11194_c0_g1_i1:94-1170(+)
MASKNTKTPSSVNPKPHISRSIACTPPTRGSLNEDDLGVSPASESAINDLFSVRVVTANYNSHNNSNNNNNAWDNFDDFSLSSDEEDGEDYDNDNDKDEDATVPGLDIDLDDNAYSSNEDDDDDDYDDDDTKAVDIDVDGLDDEDNFAFSPSIFECPLKTKFRNQPPWWFSKEDGKHIAQVVKAYSEYLQINVKSGLQDSRRLPSFIGRIERFPYQHCDMSFQTIDKVHIFRRDIRPVGCELTLTDEVYLHTKWNDQGLPQFKTLFHDKELFDDYISSANKILKKFKSFIHCLPVWESSSEFEYKVGTQNILLEYANQPYHYTKYLPTYLISTSSAANTESSFSPEKFNHNIPKAKTV